MLGLREVGWEQVGWGQVGVVGVWRSCGGRKLELEETGFRGSLGSRKLFCFVIYQLNFPKCFEHIKFTK